MLCYKKLTYNFDNTDIHICQTMIYLFFRGVWGAVHVPSPSLGGAVRLFGQI